MELDTSSSVPRGVAALGDCIRACMKPFVRHYGVCANTTGGLAACASCPGAGADQADLGPSSNVLPGVAALAQCLVVQRARIHHVLGHTTY